MTTNFAWLRMLMILLAFLSIYSLPGAESASAQCFSSGDVNNDGVSLTVGDMVYLIRYLNCGGSPPPILYQADLNGDGVVDWGDVEKYQCYFLYGIACFGGTFPVPTVCNPSTDIGGCIDGSGECKRRSLINCNASGGTYAGPGSQCDVDDDALLDCWEQVGYDFDNNGTVDVDLPAMGANYKHKDIFVEIDWMVKGPSDPSNPSFTHQPKVNALNRIITAFAVAPVSNPDGATGITLHLDYGQGAPFNGGNSVPHQEYLNMWGDFDAIKSANFAANRGKIFHYCLFGHRYAPVGNTSSGLAKGIPSSDFLVSLGGWPSNPGTEEEQAGTFMHEFGHNLGLRHGGSDNLNYKPNFLSVMGYLFQVSGLRNNGTWGNFDYSRFVSLPLNEFSLNETTGLQGPPTPNSYGTAWLCPSCNTKNWSNFANGPLDWDCNGSATTTSLNRDLNCDGSKTTLTSYNDWPNLVFDGGDVGVLLAKDASMSAQTPMTDSLIELTYEEYVQTCVHRGDANNSGTINISDAVYLIAYIFSGGEPPAQVADGDPDGNESINVSDAVYLIAYIFSGGAQPMCY